jgi:hypothetical protein
MAQIAILAVMAVMALNEGAQKRKLKMAEAKGLTEAGHRQMAATSAEVAEEKRNKERVEGRAIAVAANSGGGVDDPTIVNLIGDLNAEGEYRMMAKLYAGSDQAMGLYHQSDIAMREGEMALQQGYANAAKTVMSSYGNYGSMWAGAKSDWSKVSGAVKGTYDKYRLGRQQNKIRTIMDPGTGDYGGYA